MSGPVSLDVTAWGDLAAQRLGLHWLGRLWESDAEGLVLIGEQDEGALHLVEPSVPLHPLALVVPGIGALPTAGASFAWRVGPLLWLGEAATVRLPTTDPAPSRFDWRRAAERMDEPTLARHLARLADWFLARAPEGTLGGVLAERLGAPSAALPPRPDLPAEARLLRWRAARWLDRLLPSLVEGAVGELESTMAALAGAGAGLPPEGSHFVMGIAAGLRLWPRFLDSCTGLNERPLTARLISASQEHAGRLGAALLAAANEDQWGAPWRDLGLALGTPGPYADWSYEQVEGHAARWLAAAPHAASAGLAGLLLPFLLYQQKRVES